MRERGRWGRSEGGGERVQDGQRGREGIDLIFSPFPLHMDSLRTSD
jgi:hypothetical protein